MKVLVCGSRDWTDRDAIVRALRRYYDGNVTPVTVIHGGARGADKLGEGVARAFGFRTEEFQAAWRTEGKRAGIIRNLRMLDEKPDKVIAFQRNGSRGTQHTIDEARRRGIPVDVYPA